MKGVKLCRAKVKKVKVDNNLCTTNLIYTDW